MTMPHSKRPRRNKLNKIRAKQGLPPLAVNEGHVLNTALPGQSVGVTTIMVPLPTPIRAMLTKVRLAAQLKDPSIKASDQLFAGAMLTAMLSGMMQAAPPLIAAPTKANLEQAHKVGKILARPFHG